MTNTTTKNDAHTLWQIRFWFFVTCVFAYPIRWLWRVFHGRMGAAPRRFRERLGQSTKTSEEPVVWIHAASLGEVAQIGPLARHYLSSGTPVLVTTTSQAGADWVAQELPTALHQFAPIDTAGPVGRFLSTWDIRVAVFIEGDFGPRLTLATQASGVPMVLLNTRHSRTRDRFQTVFSALLKGFSLVTCRSEGVANSIRALGVSDERIKVLPDLRIAATKLPCAADDLETMTSALGARPVWLAASTHPGDEAAVLAAHRHVIDRHPDTLLIIAPRHPRRGAPIESSARALGFQTTRRSAHGNLTPDTQIYVADTLGELGVFLSLTPVTFLGGSYGDEGGHNPYEPASFGSAILSGPGVKNFADAFDDLCHIGASEIVPDPNALGPRLVALMQDGTAQTMGAAGRRYMEASETSTSQTVALVKANSKV